MKKNFFLISFLLLHLITPFSYAGYGWIQQPCGTINNLSCVYATSQLVCYVACPYDGLLKTIDGGENWTFLQLPSGHNVCHIFFPSATTGYITTRSFYQSKILKTTNAGNNWTMN